jgi:twitching motility protein PilT
VAPGATPVPAPAVPAQRLAAPPAETAVRVGAEDTSTDSAFLTDLLLYVLEFGCSDLHLTAGAHPTVRSSGQLLPLDEFPGDEARHAAEDALRRHVRQAARGLRGDPRAGLRVLAAGRARFRVNVYRQRDSVGAAFRLIPHEIKRLEDLGVPTRSRPSPTCRAGWCS